MSMDFAFDESQQAVLDVAREILQAEADAGRLQNPLHDAAWQGRPLVTQFAQANLLGIAIPEAHGGMGMGFGELCVLLEELGRRAQPGPWLSSLVAGALPLAQFGSEAQKAALLPPLARGDMFVSAALQGVERGEALPTASAQGEGFLLEGRVREVPCAGDAARVLTPALHQGALAFFLVKPDSPGVTLEEARTSTGEPIFEMEFSGVMLAADARLPAPGEEVLAWLMPRVWTAVSVMQVGVCAHAIQLTAEYTREREQFGTPIGAFQAVQQRLADAFIDREALRWTAWRAASRLADGLPGAAHARVAKYWAAEAGARIARACVHLHGGMGADRDYPVQRYFLWAKALELQYGGAAEMLAALGQGLAAGEMAEAEA